MSGSRYSLIVTGASEADGLLDGLRAIGRKLLACRIGEVRKGGTLTPSQTSISIPDLSEFADLLAAQHITDVIDAGHGFDGAQSLRISDACRARNVAYARYLRPGWCAGSADQWHHFADVETAARAVPKGARVLSNTGRGTQGAYAGFGGATLYLRQTSMTAAECRATQSPFPFLSYLPGTPPFSVADEMSLFRELCLDLLICRNVGGQASFSKLEAARHLKLPVFLVDRPEPPEGPVLSTMDEVKVWPGR